MSLSELEQNYGPMPNAPPEERLPPQDVAAEQSALGSMLLSKDAIGECSEIVQPIDFYRPAHETIHEAVVDLYSRGEPVDAITVADELSKRGDLARVGGTAYLHQLIAAVPTAANASYYAQIISERAMLRRLVEAGTRIVQMGYAQGGGDVEEIVNSAQAEIYSVADRRKGEDYHPLAALLEPTMDEIEHNAGSSGEMVGVPTGFTSLDELTNGLHPGQMVIVAARPAVGKSTFALDVARTAAIKHDIPTVVFSLEMSRTEITMRLLSAESEIPLQAMRKGKLEDRHWTKLAETQGRLHEKPLFIDDSPNMALMEIRAKCRRLKQRNNLKLVIVDYLQLMSSGKRVESRQQEVAEFSRALKLLAKELEVPVIALSQLNRGPEQRTDKKPQMSDLRESGCLTADTRVLRADTGAEVSLGELHTSGERDVPIWSLDESLRYVRRHLTHVFATGTKPVFRLTLASGKTLRATENHPFLTYAGWRQLGDLRTGDRIAVPRHIPAPAQHDPWDNDHQLVLLAHLLGDGSMLRRQPLCYASIDEENLRAVEQAALTFAVVAVRDEYAAARCTTLRLRSPFRLARGRHNPIAGWLDGLGVFGLRSHEKFVPEPVFHASKRQISLFLHHIWATDGSVTVSKNQRGGRIYYASNSRRLVDDLSQLLLRFGISTRTRATRKAGYRDGWTIDISGADSQRRFLQEIGVFGGRSASAATLLEIIRHRQGNTNVDTVPREVWEDVKATMTVKGVTARPLHAGINAQSGINTQYCGSTLYKSAPSRERLGRIAQVLDSADLELLAVNDVWWDTVTSIEMAGVEEVFDATVLGGHNFVANGVAVHNSIEQDADLVILLHRESMYERESPREGEADVIVAKHRNGPTDTVVVAFQGHYSRFTNMAQNF